MTIGTNTEERINNAIVALSRAARTAFWGRTLPRGRMEAVDALERHWGIFWRSKERAIVPAVAMRAKLGRYVEWYTRAWALLPADARAMAPRPDEIDPTYAGLARDTLAAYMTGVETTGRAADRAASDLTSAIKGSALTGMLGAVFGAFAVWHLFMRGRK